VLKFFQIGNEMSEVHQSGVRGLFWNSVNSI